MKHENVYEIEKVLKKRGRGKNAQCLVILGGGGISRSITLG